MSASRYAPIHRAALASATRPLHIGILGAAMVFALGAELFGEAGSLVSVLILCLGGLAYAALVGLDVSNPAYVRRINSPSQRFEGHERLDPFSVYDPQIREVYRAILSSYDNCERIYATTSDGLKQSLEDGMRRSAELVDVAARAAKKSDAVRQQLDAAGPGEIERESARLRELAEQTADGTARDGFLQAARAKEQELLTYRQLQALRDRIHAQLEVIETSLDGLSAKLVKLGATDLAEAISINESISEHLKNVTTDVDVLESSVEEAMQEFRA